MPVRRASSVPTRSDDPREQSIVDRITDLQTTAGNAAATAVVSLVSSRRLLSAPGVLPAQRAGTGAPAPDNTYIRVAGDITATFESGGDYGTLQTYDAGVISYGRHQATLAGGNLYVLVKEYVSRSHGEAATALAAYLPRLEAKDVSLAEDQTLLRLLRGAAKDPDMHKAQDETFRRQYWVHSAAKAKQVGVRSALGYALLYDTTVQGGVKYRLDEAKKKLGGKIGDVVQGHAITEQEFLLAFIQARIDAGIRQSERDQRNGAALVEQAKAEPDAAKAAALRRKGERLIANGKAMLISATKTRGPTWKALVESGDLDLHGDASGMVSLLGKRSKVKGLSAGATIEGAEAGSSGPGAPVPHTGAPATTPTKPTAATVGSTPRPGLDGGSQAALAAVIPAVTGLAVVGAGSLERVLRAVGLDLAPIVVRALAASGHRDVNQLTNVAFWAHHPDLTGSKLAPSQPRFKELAAEWVHLRDAM
ncbi:MAG TPA: chitosanase, partial [Acidimicrobiales bacterium]|nr:chitosanase [Acidimicrobiales bacterium]